MQFGGKSKIKTDTTNEEDPVEEEVSMMPPTIAQGSMCAASTTNLTQNWTILPQDLPDWEGVILREKGNSWQQAHLILHGEYLLLKKSKDSKVPKPSISACVPRSQP